MLRPSGEICGSATHCKSNTSSGFSAGFCGCAMLGAPMLRSRQAASGRNRLGIAAFLGRNPTAALMFIDDSHGLHEGIANRRAHEAKAALLEILAHRIAD